MIARPNFTTTVMLLHSNIALIYLLMLGHKDCSSIDPFCLFPIPDDLEQLKKTLLFLFQSTYTGKPLLVFIIYCYRILVQHMKAISS